MREIVEEDLEEPAVDDFKEECYFLYGVSLFGFYLGFLSYHSKGERVAVSFNWKKAAQAKFLLGFFHSHPPNCLYCSGRDKETMYAWVVAEGRPLICGILCDKTHVTYLFHRDVMEFVGSKLLGRVFIAKRGK